MSTRLLTFAAVLPSLAVSAAAQGWDETEVFAPDFTNEELFGEAVALEGDRAVIAAPDAFIQFAQLGEVHVFERTPGGGTDWSAVATLQAGELENVQGFGIVADLSGDTVAVGALQYGHGAAYIFERDMGGGGNWGQAKKLTHPQDVGWSQFGVQLALDGDTLVVASDEQASKLQFGNVWLYLRDQGGPNAWGLAANLKPSPPPASNSSFGVAVEVDGERVAVSFILHGSYGEVMLFERTDGGPSSWTQVARFSSASQSFWFGTALSLDGDRLAVAADGENGWAGAVYLFERDFGGPGAWGEVARLEASDAAPNDKFGSSVSLDSDLLAVGAPGNDDVGFGNSGSLYVFARDQGGASAWGEVSKILSSDLAHNDQLGLSVGLSGTTVLSGSRNHDHPLPGMGAGYFFEESAVAPVSYCTAGTSASGCQALLSASGTPSATAPSGFTLSAATVEGQKDGLFFFGTNGQQANPWGNGTSYQCVVPPLVRAPLMTGTGTSGVCDGSFALDLNALWCPSCPKAAKNPGGGATVQAQLWYRDPLSTSNQTTSLSNAIEFVVGL